MNSEFDPFDPAEWGNKPGCSAFETALEMRQRGALAPAAVPVLDAHLSACDSCRDHAARLARVDASLVATAALPDARRLREKMDRELKKNRRMPWVFVGLGFATTLLGAALLPHIGGPMAQHKWLLLTIPLCLAAPALAFPIRSLRLRRLLAAHDTVGAFRRWTEWNLKGTRRAPWCMVPSVVMIAFQLPGNAHRYAAGKAPGAMTMISSILLFVFFVLLVITSRRQVRRLKAELAEMH